MIIIGEKVNVMSTKLGEAMKARDPAPILEVARAQVEGGANYLDINIGPATKDGPALMEWLVTTVQNEVDVPLCLDTTNAEAMEAGLKVHKGQAIINSASGEPERLESMMGLAGKYGAKVIGLCLTKEGIPRDANERAAVAVEIMGKAMEVGVSNEDLYLDPLILPVAVAQKDALEVFESIRLFKQLADPPPKTVVGLSNVSNSAPPEVKGWLDRVFLAMVMTCGLDAAILNPLDKDLMATLKTALVFQNEILYCHSYLD
jgi:5-methyltetrahydrofolate corrinoid/iron sulfur protein methyltransferase